jgi:hypothetical protein
MWAWIGPQAIGVVWFDFAIPLPVPWKMVITLIIATVALSQGDLLRKLAINLWDESWPHAQREPQTEPILPPYKQQIWTGEMQHAATIDAQTVEPVPAGTTIVINGQPLDMPMPIPAGGEGVRAQFYRAYMSKLTNFSRGSKTKKGAMYYGFTRSEFDILQDWFQDQGLLDETDQGGWEPTSKGKRIMTGVIRAHYLDTREEE